MTGTQRNIPWYNMLIVSCAALLGISAVFRLLVKVEKFIIPHKKLILSVFCVIWGFALYLFSCTARNEPAHDYQIVYGAAENYAAGVDVDWAYFARWKNNQFLFLLLSVLMKISRMLWHGDPFYFILLFNVTAVIVTGICIYRLIWWQCGMIRYCWIGLLLFTGFIPCWGGTFNFYTDSVSIGFSIWGIYLAILAIRKKRGIFFYGIVAGLLWAIGFLIKATVGISLIAFLLIALWRWKHPGIKGCLFGILMGFIFIYGNFQVVSSRLPCSELEEDYAMPIEYWLALGSSGNGGYGENSEFATICINTPGTSAKREISREYIVERYTNLWDIKRLVSKVRYNFASGNIGLADYNRYPLTPFYEYFNDYGKYGGYITMVTSGYLYAILFLSIMGTIIKKKWKRQEESDILSLITQLTLCGLVVFLMVWESNNRQLYNHLPWLAVAGALGLQGIFGDTDVVQNDIFKQTIH